MGSERLMRAKQMILAGAIAIALATLLMIGADKRTRQVMNTEDSYEFIEQMGEKYGKIEY